MAYAAIFAEPVIAASREGRLRSLLSTPERLALRVGSPCPDELRTLWEDMQGSDTLLAITRLAYGDDTVLTEMMGTFLESFGSGRGAVFFLPGGSLLTCWRVPQGSPARAQVTLTMTPQNAGTRADVELTAQWWAGEFVRSRRDAARWRDARKLPLSVRIPVLRAQGLLPQSSPW